MEQKLERIYLSNGNKETKINQVLKKQRKSGSRLKAAWLEGRYLFLNFEPCIAGGMPPREIVKQGKKQKYHSKKAFRRFSQKSGYSKKLVNVDSHTMKGRTKIESEINTWEYIAEVETEERYYIFLRCHKFHLLKIF